MTGTAPQSTPQPAAGGNEFDWNDGVPYDITDESSIVAYFSNQGGQAPAEGGQAPQQHPGNAALENDSLGLDAGVSGTQGTGETAPEAPQEDSTDLAAFLDEALGKFAKTEETPDTPPEEGDKEPVVPKNFDELNTAFKEATGVEIKQALEVMTNFDTVAKTTLESIQTASAQLEVRMQELELKAAWANEASQLGRSLNDLVEERLTETARVYQSLDAQRKAMIDRAGADGVLTLWRHLEGRRKSSPARSVPRGRADIAQPGGTQATPDLSTITAIQDDGEYWRMMQQYYNNRRQ